MKSSIKTFGVLLAAAVVTATVVKADDNPPASTNAPATKSAPRIEDLLPDSVVAKGKGFEVKRSRLDEELTRVKASITASGRQIPPAQLPMIEVKLLDGLIISDILVAKATDADKVKGKEDSEKRFDLIKKNAQSETALALQLKSMGLTEDTLRVRLKEEATAQAVLKSKVTVKDEDVKKFYDDNPSKFEQPEMVRASHILIMTGDKNGSPMSEDDKKAKRKKIEDILKKAKEPGADFGKLAKEYSEDPGSKDNGGEYKFPRGQMVPEFEAAAFSLQTNQISDVITTSFGYHIIKLSEKIPAKKVEFAEASSNIKSYLESTEIEKIMPKLGPQLKKEAGVEILDEKLKALDESLSAAAASEIAPDKDAKPKDGAK
ncbi:MAG: Peptidylprolyl isomerase [Pedosphaera sp.]|nr:Peptidylprolyl isomerase [Pedosphaera sp.]